MGTVRSRVAVDPRAKVLAIDDDGRPAWTLDGRLVSPVTVSPPETIAAGSFVGSLLVVVRADATLAVWNGVGWAHLALEANEAMVGSVLAHPRRALVCVERFTPQDTSSIDVIDVSGDDPRVLGSLALWDVAEIVGFTSDGRALVVLVGGSSLERHEHDALHGGPSAAWHAPPHTRIAAPVGLADDLIVLSLEDEAGERLLVLSEHLEPRNEWTLPRGAEPMGVVAFDAHRLGVFRARGEAEIELSGVRLDDHPSSSARISRG
jgi:hypothetical protein